LLVFRRADPAPSVCAATIRRNEGAMTAEAASVQSIRILTAGAGDVTGDPAVALDRFLIEARDSDGQVALVEHTLAPGVLAAPMHLHSREDEYSFVLHGRLGVIQDDDEATAEAGAVVFKPRGHWHTFWNAGDETLRVLEIITPAGLEELFRRLAEPDGDYDPDTLPAIAAEYGCKVDFDRTVPLMQRHDLHF
jgi:mannose-6-phosphate isomerase-like protein (cupin superfamily)